MQIDGDRRLRVQRNANLAQNREDLESIKEGILGNFGSVQCDKRELLNLLIFYSYDPKFNINFVLKKLYEKRFVKSAKELNKEIVYGTHSYVRNDNSVQQELSTTSFSRTETKSSEISISNTFGISMSVETGIDVFFGSVSVSMGVEFSHSRTATTSESVAVTISAPSQKVIVNPHSQVKVSYYVYKYMDIHDYALDFELSDNSMIFGSVSRCYSKKLNVRQPLISYAKEHLERGKQYGKNDLKLEYTTDGKLVLRNFPATEKSINYGIKVEFGPQEPIE